MASSSDDGANMCRIMERKGSRKGSEATSFAEVAAEATAKNEYVNGAYRAEGGSPLRFALLHEFESTPGLNSRESKLRSRLLFLTMATDRIMSI